MITIYGTTNCLYCVKAKKLCQDLNLDYLYIPVDTSYEDNKYAKEFKERFPEAKTVPQILWDNKHIGGYTELVAEIENLNLGNYGQGAF